MLKENRVLVKPQATNTMNDEVTEYIIKYITKMIKKDKSKITHPLALPLDLVYGRRPSYKLMSYVCKWNWIMLKNKQTNLNAENCYGHTILFHATRFCTWPYLVYELLMQGADLNKKDILGNTPLFCARKQAIINVLIAAGADVNWKNHNEQTAFESFIENHGRCSLVMLKYAVLYNQTKLISQIFDYIRKKNKNKHDLYSKYMKVFTDDLKLTKKYNPILYNFLKETDKNKMALQVRCKNFEKIVCSLKEVNYGNLVNLKYIFSKQREPLLKQLEGIEVFQLNEKGQKIILDSIVKYDIANYLTNFELQNFIASWKHE